MNDIRGSGPGPDPVTGHIDPGVLAAAVELVFVSTPTGQEMRLESVGVANGSITVVFKGSTDNDGGPFGARLPAPAVVGDEAWERYPDPVDLDEWAMYAVLVLIVEEYDTGRVEGRGTFEDGILWLQVQ